MAFVELRDVCVDIPVFNSRNRSIKKMVMNLATGGKIGSEANGQNYVRALEDINLEIFPNEKIGLLGHNGAGKSTLLRVLGKIYKPCRGVARIEGSIGSLINISLGIDTEATGRENIFLRAALLGIPMEIVKKEMDSIIEFSQLGEFIDMPVRTYSTGMHMRLAFAVSTMISPQILLMDEWLSVGDQEFQLRAEQRLNKLIERTSILVIASHSRRLLERCCSRVLWLEHGRIVMDGNPSEVCSKYFI